jgi:nicotinamide-nucleotide amidase
MAMPLPENNKKQAFVPEGCAVLTNNNGTAPGVLIERNGKTLILLPGPPSEMEPMFLESAVPALSKKSDKTFVSRNLKIVGVGEILAEDMLKDIIRSQSNPTVAPYAKDSEVWIRITAAASDGRKANALIEPVADSIYSILGENVYGEDGDTLESVAVDLLIPYEWKLAVAESCTGGLLTSRIVNGPGASDVLIEGAVTYCNEAKVRRLGVKEETLEKYGAVSARTAAEMAEGIAETSGANVGLSTTGIAGPAGGTPEKPVGLAYIGLYIKGKGVKTIEYHSAGGRARVRSRTVTAALDFLRRELIEK